MAENNERDIDSAIKKTLFDLGELVITKFKPEQRQIMKCIIKKKDCVAILPTGYGKSLPYQVAKLVANNLGVQFGKVIVCCPLISLMKDQVQRLEKHKGLIRAMYKGEEDDPSEVENSDIIFASPEILGNKEWRSTLRKETISLIVIDEFHTVATWGELQKDEHERIFRRWFRKLGELRSHFPDASMLALSATCTTDIMELVTRALNMEKAEKIVISPDKPNIKYFIHRTGRVMESSLFWLIDHFNEQKILFPRTLIYCNSINDVSKLYSFMLGEVIDAESANMIEMFHSETTQEKKDQIIHELGKDSSLRIVIATSALGMGIDVKSCYNIILYGPSKSIVDLVQQVGRAGRDGRDSYAIVMCNSYQLSHVDSEVKNVIKSETCRRAKIMENFLYAYDEFKRVKHQCCDICAKECDCSNCDKVSQENLLEYIPKGEIDDKDTDSQSESDD